MDVIHTMHLGKILEKACRKNKDGFAVYKPEWSDKAVLDAANSTLPEGGKPFNINHVYNARALMFGKLAPRGVATTTATTDSAAMRKMAARIAALEKKVAELEGLGHAEYGLKRIGDLEQFKDAAITRMDDLQELIQKRGNKKPHSTPPG